MTQAYPLHWPEGWPRTKSPQTSRFDTTLNKAMNNVEDELQRFANDTGKRVENLVISSNFTLSDRRPRDSGVALYFSWDGISTCIAVDRYHKLEDNLQAIFRVIEAERTKMRHGGLNLVRAAFRGYAALPPPPQSSEPWHYTLGCLPDADEATIQRAYRQRAKECHPDHGGDAAHMAAINKARDEGLAQAKRRAA